MINTNGAKTFPKQEKKNVHQEPIEVKNIIMHENPRRISNHFKQGASDHGVKKSPSASLNANCTLRNQDDDEPCEKECIAP